MTRIGWIVGLVLLLPVTAQAQGLPVIDGASVARTAAQVIALTKELAEKVRQEVYKQQEVAGLPGIARYKLSPPAMGVYDTSRATGSARELLIALNTGDPRGERLDRIIAALPDMRDALARATPEGRATLERQIAWAEALRSINERSVHKSGELRTYQNGELARAAQVCEDDVTNPRTALRYPGARLGMQSGCGVVALRQLQMLGQEAVVDAELDLAAVMAQQTAEIEALRAAEYHRRYSYEAGTGLTHGSAQALRGYRFP